MIKDGHETFDQLKSAYCFNNVFIDVAPQLTSIIPESQT